MSKTSNRLILIALQALLVLTVNAQEGNSHTTSPYSRYGYGVLSDKGVGASKAMGGISYGVRTQNVNPGNPASYSGVDSLTFIFDMGISYSKTKLSETAASQSDDNGGLDYLSMQFLLNKKIGFSAGFLPYSFVGYSFGNTQELSDVSAYKYYSGSGGLSQIYGGISYKPLDRLSVGANIAYLYGNLRHVKYVSFSEAAAYSRSEERKMRLNGAKFDFGVQYQMPIFNNKKTLTIGAVYTPSISPSTKIDRLDVNALGDTLFINSANEKSKLPHTFGLGFTISDKKLMFGVDATYQKWEDLEYSNSMGDDLSYSDRFNNKLKINAGLEYVINPIDRNFLKRVKMRAGASYSNSYLNVRSDDGSISGYKEYGATLGFGLPFRGGYSGRTTYINLGFEYSRFAPDKRNTMIKEEFFGVSLGLNLNDLWFVKNKFK